jgi:hypothetical protein
MLYFGSAKDTSGRLDPDITFSMDKRHFSWHGRDYSIKSVLRREGKHEVLGHNDVRTTMIYTYVLNRGGKAVKSPADNLREIRRCAFCGTHTLMKLGGNWTLYLGHEVVGRLRALIVARHYSHRQRGGSA